MHIIPTIKRWLRNLFRKKRSDEFVTGVSATPEFPDPYTLITWILRGYRKGVDKAACFTLEHVRDPLIRVVYDEPVEIIISYPPPFSPEERLKTIGLPPPKGFTLTDWRRHEQFTLTGPMLPSHEMAIFLNLLFQKLYRAEKDYVMAAWTDMTPATQAHHPKPQEKNAAP